LQYHLPMWWLSKWFWRSVRFNRPFGLSQLVMDNRDRTNIQERVGHKWVFQGNGASFAGLSEWGILVVEEGVGLQDSDRVSSLIASGQLRKIFRFLWGKCQKDGDLSISLFSNWFDERHFK
jgi:hypothetical protein